jgi:enamine deaminase RidA (YjgF/YER057c/UK114 family)
MQNAISHQPVLAEGLPKPIGPYSPGMVLDRLVFVSGQGATDPATGRLAGLDIETQTEQVFRNLRATHWARPQPRRAPFSGPGRGGPALLS